MTDNSFDKFIKEKLNNFSSPVPDGLWEKIAQEKDRKPVGAFGWKNYGVAFIGIVAVLFCTLFFYNHNSKDGSSYLNSQSSSGIDNNKKEIPVQILQQSSSEKQNLATGTDQTSDNKVTNLPSQLPNNDESINDKNQTAIASSSSVDFSANKPTATLPTSARKAATRQANIKWNPGTTQSGSIQNNLYKIGSLNNQYQAKENVNADNASTFLNKTVFLRTIETGKNFNEFSANDRLIKDLKDSKLLSTYCPSVREQVRHDVYLEVYGSPDYAKKTINNSSSANSAFLQRKDSTENMRLSYTAGFRLTKTIGENFLLKAGLQYSQINEKFTYRSENERKLTTVITIRTVIRSAGDTIIVKDTSSVEQIGYRVKTTYNRYKSIDLPLLIGYEWGNDNFKAAVSGGVILNLYSWQKGESLDTSFVPVAFNKSSGQTFKQNIGLGLYGSISVLKKVGDKTELFVEPYFRYNLSNMTNNKSVFNQKFQVAGINMGIRYKLNGGRQR